MKMKSNNLLKKDNKIQYLIIGIFFLLFLLINIGVQRQNGDDIVHLETFKNSENIFSLLKLRYLNWSGRVICEFFMYLLLDQNIIIWKVINSLMMLILSLGIYKFVSINGENDNNKYLMIAVMMSIFLLPLNVFSSSITWITGSFNYLWPLSLGIVCLVFMKKYLYGYKMTPIMFILFSVLAIFACSQEQVAAILIGFNIFVISFYIFIYKKLDYKLLAMFSVVFLSGCFSIFAPGNKLRYFTEIDKWYSGFDDLSISYKFLESLSYSLDRFVNIFYSNNHQFNLLMVSISLLIFFTCKDKKFIRNISIVPVIYFLIKVLFNPNFGYLIFDQDKFLGTINGVISLVLATIVFIIMMISLYYCFDTIEDRLVSIILFFGAVLSGFVVGFSPTIFASGHRIFFCSFILFIIVFGMLFVLGLNKFKGNIWFILSQILYVSYLSLMILLYIIKWSGAWYC